MPTIVKKCSILPPQSRMGALEEEDRSREIKENLLYTKYAAAVDRESAYEILEKRVLEEQAQAQKQKEEAAAEKAAPERRGSGGNSVRRKRQQPKSSREEGSGQKQRSAECDQTGCQQRRRHHWQRAGK